MPVLEKDVQSRSLAYVRSCGGRAYKLDTRGRRSAPDTIIVTHTGRTAFVEFKRAGEKLRDDQELEIQKLLSIGAVATWCDRFSAFQRFYDALATS